MVRTFFSYKTLASEFCLHHQNRVKLSAHIAIDYLMTLVKLFAITIEQDCIIYYELVYIQVKE